MPRLILGRSGSTAVEFALVITPFMLMLIGGAQLGIFFWTQHTLQAACEAGSHYVYAHSTDALSAIQAALPAQVQAAATGLTAAHVTVTTSTSTYNGSNFITITASYPVSFTTMLDLPITTATAQATVPVE